MTANQLEIKLAAVNNLYTERKAGCERKRILQDPFPVGETTGYGNTKPDGRE
jgi:hypothetical protein